MKLKKSKTLLEHIFGLAGQVSSGLPLLLITSMISVSQGLQQAGEFTILVGFSSTVFSLTLWGFRTLIVLNKETFSPKLYLISRLFMLILSAGVILVFSKVMGYPFGFSMIIVLVKSTDAIIDLNFGFLQLKGSYIALKEYAILHVSKFIAIGILLFLSYFSFLKEINIYLIIIGVVLFTGAMLKLLYCEDIKLNFEGITFLKIKSLFVKSFVFVVATITCAFLTNSPRFFLDVFSQGDLLGVIGICLSVSTLFGMVFNTNWQRYFSNLNATNNRYTFSVKFFFQNILVAVILALFSFFILPYLVSIFFKIDLDIYIEIMQLIFLSFIVFNLGMSALNLYKWTSKPILESYSYFAAFIIPFLLAVMWEGMFEIYHLLLIAGVVMLLLSTYSLYYIKQENGEQ
jgi:hypothetical protein